ncbi:hypothetical protein CHS0354_012894 [Potamilus streckersoni]|uniref:Enoyl reductase (ER) domain-containing protein n=1 Tax=Potamilus streckersoni TaxID=2493646 RepID=A0AAE0SAN1_9BIVA|nr:hypothetical protein CHS0354_012894 [Potamilus streckersoni]
MRVPVLFRVLSLVHSINQGMAIRTMYRYAYFEPGGPEKLEIRSQELPTTVKDKHVLIKVFSTAVNRADTLQRKGFYPPPPGESEILGLEAAGVVDKLGPNCSDRWKKGDRVMALLAGGGYAEYATVHEDLLLNVPSNLNLTEAGGIPEVWLTAYQLLFFVGNVQPGDIVLIHAGASGVGTAAIQLTRHAGATPLITAGSSAKIQTALDLGASKGFNYKDGDFSKAVLEATNGRGVDVILDCVGASFYEQNIDSIATDGRWVLYGLMGGGSINADIFSKLLRKRVSLLATLLRSRSREYKKKLINSFTEQILPLFERGELKLTIDRILPFDKVAEAHKLMESNTNTGKIILKVHEEIQSNLTQHEEL